MKPVFDGGAALNVLILVVVDDSLVLFQLDWTHCSLNSRVLILVVVDDSLVLDLIRHC